MIYETCYDYRFYVLSFCCGYLIYGQSRVRLLAGCGSLSGNEYLIEVMISTSNEKDIYLSIDVRKLSLKRVTF